MTRNLRALTFSAFLLSGALSTEPVADKPLEESPVLPTSIAEPLAQTEVVEVEEEALIACGEAGYRASEYSCFDGHILCPIDFGQPTLPCHGTCYSPDLYSCSTTYNAQGESQVELLPHAIGSFDLFVHSTNPLLNNLPVHACDNHFIIGPGAETCVYCYHAPPMFDCATYGNKMVLDGQGSMAVDVPGGQYWYLDAESEVLMFTEGGKANGPEMLDAADGVTVYEQGYFAPNGAPHIWLACSPSGEENGGEEQVYYLYGPTAQNWERPACHPIKIASEPAPRKEGAYTYQ